MKKLLTMVLLASFSTATFAEEEKSGYYEGAKEFMGNYKKFLDSPEGQAVTNKAKEIGKASGDTLKGFGAGFKDLSAPNDRLCSRMEYNYELVLKHPLFSKESTQMIEDAIVENANISIISRTPNLDFLTRRMNVSVENLKRGTIYEEMVPFDKVADRLNSFFRKELKGIEPNGYRCSLDYAMEKFHGTKVEKDGKYVKNMNLFEPAINEYIDLLNIAGYKYAHEQFETLTTRLPERP